MDINENGKLEDFELLVNKISEGVDYNTSTKITEDMVKKSIDKQFENNRSITIGVSISMLESILDNMMSYSETSERGR